MTDFIIKDIEELIKLNKGDSQRLGRIKDDFNKTKIITLPDRKYVESLVSRYVKEEPKEKKRDFMKSFQEMSFKKPRVPEPARESLGQRQDVVIPKVEQIKLAELKKPDHAKPTLHKTQHQYSIFAKQREGSSSEGMPTKKILLIAVPVIIAIIVIGVAASQLDFRELARSNTNTEPIPPGLSVATDQHSYNKGDIISISGTSQASAGNEIKLSIENPNGGLVWSETVKIKSNGKFSTLLIAAGAGWDNNGEYTLKAEHGSLANQIKFDFNA